MISGVGEPKAIPWTNISPLKSAADAWCHLDVQRSDVIAWPTNLGWMMGPWLVYASLINGACMGLYNGSPLGPAFAKFVQVCHKTMHSHLMVKTERKTLKETKEKHIL